MKIYNESMKAAQGKFMDFQLEGVQPKQVQIAYTSDDGEIGTPFDAFVVQSITEEVNVCSVRNKKEVSRILGIKDYNTLNNYIKRFKDKGVVSKKDNNYKLNNLLNPSTSSVEITINKE